jgi:hypothetical protein
VGEWKHDHAVKAVKAVSMLHGSQPTHREAREPSRAAGDCLLSPLYLLLLRDEQKSIVFSTLHVAWVPTSTS